MGDLRWVLKLEVQKITDVSADMDCDAAVSGPHSGATPHPLMTATTRRRILETVVNILQVVQMVLRSSDRSPRYRATRSVDMYRSSPHRSNEMSLIQVMRDIPRSWFPF